MISISLRFLAYFTRTFSSFRGRWRLMRWLGRQDISFKKLGDPLIIKTREGFKIFVCPSEFIGRHIFIDGSYEHDCVNIFKYRLREGDVVLDIGANIGFFSLLAAKCVGTSGAVYSYEASSSCINILKKNISINGYSNISSNQFAITDACENIEFHVSNENNTGLSSIRDIGENKVSTVNVPCINIDSLLDTLPKVRLVKIDIEGAEYKALSGMEKLIKRDRPDIIMEVSDSFLKQMGSSANEVLFLLKTHKYRLFNISDNSSPSDAATAIDQYNIWAIHSENYSNENIQCFHNEIFV